MTPALLCQGNQSSLLHNGLWDKMSLLLALLALRCVFMYKGGFIAQKGPNIILSAFSEAPVTFKIKSITYNILVVDKHNCCMKQCWDEYSNYLNIRIIVSEYYYSYSYSVQLQLSNNIRIFE